MRTRTGALIYGLACAGILGALAFGSFVYNPLEVPPVDADAHGSGSKYDHTAICWSYDCDTVHTLREISKKLDRTNELLERIAGAGLG